MKLHTEAVRQAKLLEHMGRGFGGAARTVPDNSHSDCVAFAAVALAWSALRPGPMARPPVPDAGAWGSLQGAFVRVLGAWRNDRA